MATPNETEHWKVRIIIEGNSIQCMSVTEPEVEFDPGGRVKNIKWDPITGTPDGDTIGFMDWSKVSSVTWKFIPVTPKIEPKPDPKTKDQDAKDKAIRAFSLMPDTFAYHDFYTAIRNATGLYAGPTKAIISQFRAAKLIVKGEDGLFRKNNPTIEQ